MTDRAPPVGPAFFHRPPEERRQLAEIKRCLERFLGDGAFRDGCGALLAGHAVESGEDADDGAAALHREHGITVDVRALRPLLEPGFGGDLDDYPLVRLWQAHMVSQFAYRDGVVVRGDTGGHNPAYDRWRHRQIARCRGELGSTASSIVHPVVAFELSSGCSVGCWFCGISAGAFAGHAPYADNQALWRGMLAQTVAFFGATAAGTGFCYWATDPADNPDYPAFIADFHAATGVVPQTTTAAPLKNPDLTRAVLALTERHQTTINRFSVLNTRLLRQIHAAFTAEELLGVELVLQQQDSLNAKAFAGRARRRPAAKRPLDEAQDHPTIACVTGFLVNLPQRTVRLITPTRATDACPDGFHTLGEASFTTADEFGAALRHLLAQVPDELAMDDVLALRPDLAATPDAAGFTLRDAGLRYQVHHPAAALLLPLLLEGRRTVRDAYRACLTAGIDLRALANLLHRLFALGVLSEEPGRPGISGVRRSLPPQAA
ncbi:radical SAM family RiPP maturation amino acid epimerase [Nitrospirillum sp. BR 11163]|uniref:radical SAM family RiPP maturation amino acid epimerase n=1 Tax=Nitrospirillum sp. BR 11163 TaxID=3104323 RepID=UPI002AFE42E7|nr:radical SAM family RiPP maturation amino acid epimerase [Nitrospirillum sp. BR 11163]MEA1672592.1 radical SAM family RiPP maturation amino acid epimerase [Nitrospirillum sp. BR 11163]